MATTYHGAGTQSPTALSKPLERVFEDAQHTGEIQLSGRKLREYPKIAVKYDLVDTISTDLSKNRLNEVPREVCGYTSTEKLNCYHNVIKSIPESIVQLQALTYLNLSRNQLSIIPSFISQIQTLEVLIASHNRLVSLPEEIGVLDKLMELDVSCNQISHLPLQIGDLKSLKSLNMRRNLLVELPIEISKLNLRKLDFSSNRISKIPTVFRKIETLEQIILDHNPLTMPPAHVCTKGKQHIMKFLQIEAIRDDKKRGILNDVEMKRFRKSLPPQQSVSSEEFRNLLESPDKWKRHTVLSSDSGYSTTDSVDKCGWSPQEVNGDSHIEDASILAYKAATAASVIYRDKRPSRDDNTGIFPPPVNTIQQPVNVISPQPVNTNQPTQPSPEGIPRYDSATHRPPFISPKPAIPVPVPVTYPPSPHNPQTPPTPQGPGPGIGAVGDDDFTRELQRQKLEYESKKKVAEQLRRQQEEDEREQRRRAAQRLQEEQQAMLEKQREDTRMQEEQARAWEEARKREAEELQRQEELRKAEETRQQQLQQQQEEAKQYRTENNFYYNRYTSQVNNSQAWPPPPPSPVISYYNSNAWINSPVSPNSPSLPAWQQRGSSPSSPSVSTWQHHVSPSSVRNSQTTSPITSNTTRNTPPPPPPRVATGNRTPSPRVSNGNNIPSPGNNVINTTWTPPTPSTPTSSYSHDRSPTYSHERSSSYSHERSSSRSSAYSQDRLPEEYDSYKESLMNRQNYSSYGMSYNDRKPVQSSNSFKEEKRNPGSSQPYRRTVSDSNQRLPAHTSIPVSQAPDIVRNGPIQETINGQSPTHSPVNSNLPSPTTTQNTHNATPPHSTQTPHTINSTSQPHHATVPSHVTVSANGSRPTTPQGSGVTRRSKVGDKVQPASSASNPSRVAKPTERHGRATTTTTTTRTGLPSSRKNQDEELRKSQQDLKSSHGTEQPKVRSRAEDQRLRTLQKESNTYLNRRSSGSTSSEDDKKRATPTRLTTFSSTSAAAKRSGTGTSSTSSAVSRVTSSRPSTAGVTGAGARSTATGSATARRAQTSTTSSSTAANKSKRSGAVMTNATVKMIENYKDADPNFTLARQHEHHKEEQEQLEKLRKTISSRLKRSLPDNLSEALCDGVLLCHLANQIRPRSVASVHVPSPAVPKLTPAKCRRNVENFLEACRKIGVQREDLCAWEDIVEWCRPARVALTVQHLTRFPRLTTREFLITYLCFLIQAATCCFIVWHALYW